MLRRLYSTKCPGQIPSLAQPIQLVETPFQHPLASPHLLGSGGQQLDSLPFRRKPEYLLSKCALRQTLDTLWRSYIRLGWEKEFPLVVDFDMSAENAL